LAAALEPQTLLAETDLGSLWMGTWRGQAALLRVLPRGGQHNASLIRQAIRAAARVKHPAVATTLEFGKVGPALSRRSGLTEGRLYVASDPPYEQTLRGTPLSAARLLDLLDQILSGLTAIHARGLVHGDINADSIEVENHQARLRDVGLTIAAMREGLLPIPSDAPGVATELRQGLWHELGPAVDLHALACTVRERISDIEVPEGLHDWIERLLQRRVVRASEAARELRALDNGRADAFSPVVSRSGPRLTAAVGLTGREDEQQKLWDALNRMRSGEVGVVLVEGASGSGRSALVGWLTTHAQQGGLATVLSGGYGPTGAVREGLGRLIVQHLGCSGLEGQALRGRLKTRLRSWAMAEEWEVRGLIGVVDPTNFPLDAGDARLRPTVVRRFLEGCVTRRGPGEWTRTEPTPLIVVLEDVQWGLEAFALAQLLLRSSSLPILVVMTCSTDEMVWHGAESQALEELCADDRVTRIPLPPLPADVLAQLAATQMPEDLAKRLATTARGNPLHVSEVMASYEERGRPDTLALPDSLAAALLLRIERREVQFALELLACLGLEAPISEWRSVCEAWGLSARTGWLEDLADRGLLHLDVHVDRVRITHTALRRALLTTAEREGRLAGHHRACATVLATHAGRNVMARVGNHHFSAGDHHLAVPALLNGAEERVKQARGSTAMKLVAHAADALGHVRGGVDERQRTRLFILQAQANHLQGRLHEAVESAEQAVHRARWIADTQLLGQALTERARSARAIGELSLALGALREALTLLEGAAKAEVALEMGAVLSDLGAIDDASEALQVARSEFMLVGHRMGLANSLRWLGDLALRRGDVAWAATLLEAARQGYDELGSAWGAMSCHNSLGELWRAKGDLEGAERHYRAASSLARAMDALDALVPDVNRALVLELQGRHREAGFILRKCLNQADQRGARLLSAICHVALLPTLAATQEWDALDTHYALGNSLLRETGYVHGDIAQLARRAADRSRGSRKDALLRMAVVQYRQLGQLKDVAELKAMLPSA